MHCPSCGNESSLEQKFCRKCGFELSPVSKLITAQSGTESIAMANKEREQILLKRLFRGMSAGFIVLGLGVLMLVTGRALELGKIFGLMSTIVMLAGIAVTFTALFSTMIKGATREATKLSTNLPNEVEKARTTKQLEGDKIPAPVASVTERTTQLIDKKS